ncbi:fasciclin-1 [Nephila pilipes]|uniref:Fasciclin-1 n=1 Tax=Nephila pilipes TaxID=299642 RepID=A0A8X6PD91_NEPPI|nr:fasciclin-1 [Nephila pilipes]
MPLTLFFLALVNQVAEKTSFPFKSPTSLAGSPPLYLAVKEGPGFWKEYYVNNAKILRSEDYVSQEGTKQLLYVIDEILQPYVSSTSLPPTALDLLDKPELYDIREPLSAFDFRVKQEGLQELFMREGNNTFFLPVGAGVGHSFNRQQEVDKWVIRGHVIPRTILFTRLVSFDSYPSEAYGDDIKVELTIINESNAMGNSYSLYAQSNTIHSDYRHKKGVVMAKILKPNIPVKNGVVHLIESPLMIIDITVWKFLQNERDGRLSEFLDLVNYAPDFKEILMSSQEKTLFAPSNEAIRQLPAESVALIKTNITAITNLLKLHLVMKSISTDDVLYGRYKDFISADNRNSLYFRILGDEKNKSNNIALTVDGVGVKAAAVQADIGAVDGMVHIIDRLLGMPYQTVYLKLESDPDLKVTSQLAEQDDWGAVLNGNEKRFTFFVPGDEAWAQLRKEMPTEFKQLSMGVFPYHVHKILDRHLVVNRELRSSDLERLKEIQMVHGHFKVIHGGYPNGELLLEWEGLQARIIRPDVQAVNGVIHVIDRVMMKRRDLTKSGSPTGPRCAGFLLFILALIQVAILF